MQVRVLPVVVFLRNAVVAFVRHDGTTLAAALAFYVSLAFAPTVVLSLWVAASIGRDAQQGLLNELDLLGGPNVRAVAQLVIDHAQAHPVAGTLAAALGIVFLVISASAVFGQLQATLETMWALPPRQPRRVLRWLRQRLLSIGMLAASIFILIVTLVVSTVLSWIVGAFAIIWQIVNQLIALAVFTTVFAGLFRYLPDHRIPVRIAIQGGFSTGALFMIGKFLIGAYLSHSTAGSAYGPAGAFVILLLWVYYSSLVFYFGAEIVGQCLLASGHRPAPIRASRRRA